jgi:hypothetical protein
MMAMAVCGSALIGLAPRAIGSRLFHRPGKWVGDGPEFELLGSAVGRMGWWQVNPDRFTGAAN